uniref:Uncharacterized protein n=1 Tax=Rhizophora mucronata TaxID=61149 RepID=A0A2P2Q9G4_RHIMU
MPSGDLHHDILGHHCKASDSHNYHKQQNFYT